jgi:hypothetical protein
MNRKLVRILIVVALVAATFVFASTVLAGNEACDTRVNNNFNKLLECVTVEGVREHQAAFQAIADANNGIRTSGTPAMIESVDYVVERMTPPGITWYCPGIPVPDLHLTVHVHLEQVAPPPAGPIANNILSYSGQR